MPYIDQESRDRLAEGGKPGTPGELNFCLTVWITDYIDRKGGSKYVVFNEVLGVLTCIIQELYRREVAPYEDIKMEENGDVF